MYAVIFCLCRVFGCQRRSTYFCWWGILVGRITDLELRQRGLQIRVCGGDDLMDKLVKINADGEPTINMGHGKYRKLSDNCEIVAKVDDRERFRFGYRDHITGKEEIISGKLAEFEDVFGDGELLFGDFKIYNNDNRGPSGILPEKENDGQWLKTATQVNMISGEVFDMGMKVRMNLERIHTSEALVNNRLAKGGLAGKYNVLRESAGYMRRFKNVAKFGGRVFFWSGTALSVIDGYDAYKEEDDERLYMAGVDIAINAVLFFSGVGIMGIPAYYLLKEMFRPLNLPSRPFNPDDLGKPYYHEPDNLRIDRPLFIP